MSGRMCALKPASLEAISHRKARADLAALMQRGRAALAAWRRVSRERLELMDLSERALRDIGLPPAAAARRQQVFFWQV